MAKEEKEEVLQHRQCLGNGDCDRWIARFGQKETKHEAKGGMKSIGIWSNGEMNLHIT